MVVSRLQVAVVFGVPKGFTRAVTETLLKDGNRVIIACPDPEVARTENLRLSERYGSSKINMALVEKNSVADLETVILRALDTHGGINTLINSATDETIQLTREDLHGSVDRVDSLADGLVHQRLVKSIKDVSKVGIKYLGRHNGFQGGNILHLASSVELQPGFKSTGCTVLGTMRALGLEKDVKLHDVRTTAVYDPVTCYSALTLPSKVSAYQYRQQFYENYKHLMNVSESTGQMAVGFMENSKPGSVGRFCPDFTVQEVKPQDMPCSCRVTNKMCYWLGCCHTEDAIQKSPQHAASKDDIYRTRSDPPQVKGGHNLQDS